MIRYRLSDCPIICADKGCRIIRVRVRSRPDEGCPIFRVGLSVAMSAQGTSLYMSYCRHVRSYTLQHRGEAISLEFNSELSPTRDVGLFIQNSIPKSLRRRLSDISAELNSEVAPMKGVDISPEFNAKILSHMA